MRRLRGDRTTVFQYLKEIYNKVGDCVETRGAIRRRQGATGTLCNGRGCIQAICMYPGLWVTNNVVLKILYGFTLQCEMIDVFWSSRNTPSAKKTDGQEFQGTCLLWCKVRTHYSVCLSKREKKKKSWKTGSKDYPILRQSLYVYDWHPLRQFVGAVFFAELELGLESIALSHLSGWLCCLWPGLAQKA